MKNPLRKRIPRELKGEFGKYLVVFLLMEYKRLRDEERAAVRTNAAD